MTTLHVRRINYFEVLWGFFFYLDTFNLNKKTTERVRDSVAYSG